MLQNQEEKQIPRYEVRFTNKNHPFMWLVCKTRAKILLSNPETSLTTPRLLPLRRLRRSYENYQSHPVVRIVLKYFETTGAIWTIRMIIWKPGFTTDQGDPNINPIWPNLTQSISDFFNWLPDIPRYDCVFRYAPDKFFYSPKLATASTGTRFLTFSWHFFDWGRSLSDHLKLSCAREIHITACNWFDRKQPENEFQETSE